MPVVRHNPPVTLYLADLVKNGGQTEALQVTTSGQVRKLVLGSPITTLGADALGDVYWAPLNSGKLIGEAFSGGQQTTYDPGGQPRGVAVPSDRVFVTCAGCTAPIVFVRTNPSQKGPYPSSSCTQNADCSLKDPEGLGFAGGEILAADTGNSRVVEFDSAGARSSPLEIAFKAPHFAAGDQATDEFVWDDTGVVEVRHGSGGQKTARSTGGIAVGGLAVDAAGDFFVLDRAGGRVVEFPTLGAPSFTVIDGLDSPSELAIASGS